MTLLHVHREGTEYQVVCTTARTGVEVPIPCRTRDELVAVLRALGVDHAGLTDVFNQLDASPDAEVRV
jgi:predicted glycosyltransferase